MTVPPFGCRKSGLSAMDAVPVPAERWNYRLGTSEEMILMREGHETRWGGHETRGYEPRSGDETRGGRPEGDREMVGHEMRWGGLAGIGAVLFAIVARIVMGGTPRSTDTMGVIASYMNDNRGRILLAAVLYSIAIALFLWFGATLATMFRRADDASGMPAIVLAGFTFVSAIAFVAIAMFGAAAYALTVHAGLLILAAVPFSATTVLATIGGIAMALPLAAVAMAIARTHVFPMWMAYFAGIVGLVSLVAAFTVWATKGAWAPGGWIPAYIPMVLLGLWILAASGLLVREHLPMMRTRAPHVMGA
jgi:hypothetical protein